MTKRREIYHIWVNNLKRSHISKNMYTVYTHKKQYLGHIINDEMSDDEDRQRRRLYAQANMLV